VSRKATRQGGGKMMTKEVPAGEGIAWVVDGVRGELEMGRSEFTVVI
jgi:hypothetical protein